MLDQQQVHTDTTPAPVALAHVRNLAPPCPFPSSPCSTARPTPRGAPCTDGELQPNDPTTHGSPSGQASVQDEHGTTIESTGWQHLHLRETRWLHLSVIHACAGVSGLVTQTLIWPRSHWARCSASVTNRAPASRSTPSGGPRRARVLQSRVHALAWWRPSHSIIWDWPASWPVRRGMSTYIPPLGTPTRPPHPRGTSPQACRPLAKRSRHGPHWCLSRSLTRSFTDFEILKGCSSKQEPCCPQFARSFVKSACKADIRPRRQNRGAVRRCSGGCPRRLAAQQLHLSRCQPL